MARTVKRKERVVLSTRLIILKQKSRKIAIIFIITISLFTLSGCTLSVKVYNLINSVADMIGVEKPINKWYTKELAFELNPTQDGYICTGFKDKTIEYNLSKLVIPSEYKQLPVVAISGGFNGCTSLTSITIPDSVTSIGNRAFYNCTSLTSITIPDSVTSIGYQAFYNCTSLTSIIIPDSVTSIGDDAFHVCISLIYNEYGNGLYLGNEENPYVVLMDTKSTDITSCIINENTKIIYDHAFSNCSSLESITLPFVGNRLNGTTDTHFGYIFGASSSSDNDDYVPTSLKEVIITGGTSIDSSAFRGCSSLTSITILEGVTSIGDFAFDGCSSLTSITIPEGVTSIGDYAFWGCSSLTSITIPEGVTSIGRYAFYGCSSLTSITIPEGVTSIGNRAFYNCSSLESITIPEGVTSIGEYAFYNCSSLESITIPKGVTSIDYFAFYNCTSLTSITIPEGVTSIRRDAFYGCSSLTSITIPSSVTSIGSSAFYECSSITSIIIPESVTSIGDFAFSGSSSLIIYCEVESKPSGWNSYWNPYKRPVVWGYTQ